MKNIFFAVVFISLLLAPVSQAASQSASSSNIFDMTDSPQWAKDLRRWDIIAFGSFPFALFTVTFLTDLYRWNEAAGLSFDTEGLRYAPWPLKPAGYVEMTNEEYERTVWLAVGLAATVAVTDLIIVSIKRNKERRRMENRPVGSYKIKKKTDIQPEENLVEDSSEITDEPGAEEKGKTE